MKFLPDSLVVHERVCADTPALIRDAIAFAGRLAADQGAWVVADPGLAGTGPVERQLFLRDGKHAAPPAHVGTELIIAAADAHWPDPAVPGVLVHTLPAAIDPTGQALAAGKPQPVSELSLQARSGLCELIGDPQRSGLKLGGQQTAFASGYAIHAALMGVLLKYTRFAQIERALLDPLSVMAWVNWKAVLLGASDRVLKREGALAEWPVLACADGYAAIIFNERDWPVLLELIGEPRLRDAALSSHAGRQANRASYQALIAQWVAGQSRASLEQAFSAAGLPSAVVASIDALLDDPLLLHRKAFQTISTTDGRAALRPVVPQRASVLGGGAPDIRRASPPSSGPVLPMTGIRVLDMGIITAGAGASALLADMGAEVLKLESDNYPDPFRFWAGDTDRGSPMFRYTNRNKRGIAIDLKQASGRAQFLALVARSDVVLENFRRGVLERLGIGFETLARANPNIMLVSLTSQGLSGPGAGNASYGSGIEARSGIASLTGYADGLPVISGRSLNYPDQIACLFGAGTVAAALHWQQTHGGALHLDVSQRDLASFTLGEHIIRASLRRIAPEGSDAASGGATSAVDGPTGNDDSDHALQGIFKCGDGRELAVSVRHQSLAALADALFLPLDFSPDDEAGARAVRQLTRWIADQPAELVCSRLRAMSVACEPVQSSAQAFADPLIRRGPAVGHTPSGELAKGFPFQFELEPMRINCDAPAIGQHNPEYLHHESN